MSPGRAQSPLEATLTPPDSTAFPEMETFLDVYRAPGKFWHGLTTEQVNILENGQSVTISTLEEIRPGVQVVLAVNPGPSFAIRDAQGLSRYDYLVAALKNWTQSRRGSTLDDLSLLFGGQISRTHFVDPSELTSLLESTLVDTRLATPNLDVLSQALDVATDPTARSGMKRAILLVTAPIEGEITFALENFVARALQQRVRVYVWVVAPEDMLDSPSVTQLLQVSVATGGEGFFYSGKEFPPSPDNYFNGLRSVYRLTYRSTIREGGAQELQVVIEAEGNQVQSELVPFTLDLQPPDPALLNPVIELTRSLPAGTILQELDASFVDRLEPVVQPLEILVDFPDGKPRPLAYTRLYVDGELVAENTFQPFDQFVWSLAPYTTTQQHILQIEAQDKLGLAARSIETPVNIIVDLPVPNSWQAILRNGPLLVATVLGLSVLVTLLLLVVTGRIHPRNLRGPWNRLQGKEPRRGDQSSGESLKKSRPASISQPASPISGWVSRLHWPQRRLKVKTNAFFIPLTKGESGHSEQPIPITTDEVTLGRDKNLATFIFPDLSVDALHARLLHKADETYWILDEGSVAGTWVNYELVPPEGARLEHGDLIHLGRVSLRFQRPAARPLQKPVIHYQDS